MSGRETNYTPEEICLKDEEQKVKSARGTSRRKGRLPCLGREKIIPGAENIKDKGAGKRMMCLCEERKGKGWTGFPRMGRRHFG